uniref:C1q domain-containing protein n=1 Tax=Magallana gigas TaxID=29159 RepID=A0A8W8NXG3_MAGGI|nr:C1q-related factor-like [Crassostrea gigas]
MLLALAFLWLSVFWAQCEKESPKPGLKLFREDYKSVQETCIAVGFVKNSCGNDTKIGIAFDARLGKQIRNLATKGRVVFDTVNLNQGLGYDASTGVFTVPSGGTYVFEWTILAWEGLVAHTALAVNNQFKSWNYCQPGKSNNWRSCSKMSILKLNKGDKVGITVFNGPADIHLKYTSFSGFKL